MTSGTPVITTTRTREHLLARDGDSRTGDAARFLPTDTFEHEHVVELGRKTLRLLHPGRGHTDGDLVALFVEDGAVPLGDLLFHDLYPDVDLEAGGSVCLWPEAPRRVQELPFDRVIPGHGALADRASVGRYERFLAEVAREARAAVDRGWSLEQARREIQLRDNAAMRPFGLLPLVASFDRDFLIGRAPTRKRPARRSSTPVRGEPEAPTLPRFRTGFLRAHA
jgi:glyoxylase-like metal-dependent hydrolase (beta-lactamase superfamily II)